MQYFKCQTAACCGRAKCIVLINEEYRIINFDNHIAHDVNRCEWNYPKVIAIYYRECMLELVTNGAKYTEAYNWAIREIRSHYNNDVLEEFGVHKKYKSTAQRISAFNMPHVPTKETLNTLIIPFPYNKTLVTNQDFLALNFSFNMEDGREAKILVFCTKEAFIRLIESIEAWMDGTFKTCPLPFYQLFILHTLNTNRLLPALYCLLSHKTEEIYNCLFKWIVWQANKLDLLVKWEIVHVDFERAIENAVRRNVNLRELRGCQFHYCQANYEMVFVNNIIIFISYYNFSYNFNKRITL